MTQNCEGLTYDEWRAAATGGVGRDFFSDDFARQQWAAGIDPTEWRAAHERFEMPREGMETPWGPAQSVTPVLAGIWCVDTASHGGFYLSPERQDRMHLLLRTTHPLHPFPNQWYEEDLDYLRVVLNFEDEFRASGLHIDVDAAAQSFQGWHPETYKNWRTRCG